MPKKCTPLIEMIKDGKLKALPYTYIDAYNRLQRTDGITGTMCLRTDSSNQRFVSVKVKKRSSAD